MGQCLLAPKDQYRSIQNIALFGPDLEWQVKVAELQYDCKSNEITNTHTKSVAYGTQKYSRQERLNVTGIKSQHGMKGVIGKVAPKIVPGMVSTRRLYVSYAKKDITYQDRQNNPQTGNYKEIVQESTIKLHNEFDVPKDLETLYCYIVSNDVEFFIICFNNRIHRVEKLFDVMFGTVDPPEGVQILFNSLDDGTTTKEVVEKVIDVTGHYYPPISGDARKAFIVQNESLSSNCNVKFYECGGVKKYDAFMDNGLVPIYQTRNDRVHGRVMFSWESAKESLVYTADGVPLKGQLGEANQDLDISEYTKIFPPRTDRNERPIYYRKLPLTDDLVLKFELDTSPLLEKYTYGVIPGIGRVPCAYGALRIFKKSEAYVGCYTLVETIANYVFAIKGNIDATDLTIVHTNDDGTLDSEGTRYLWNLELLQNLIFYQDDVVAIGNGTISSKIYRPDRSYIYDIFGAPMLITKDTVEKNFEAAVRQYMNNNGGIES